MTSLFTYAVRRLLRVPLVLIATFALAFLLVRAAPDGPFDRFGPRARAECAGDEAIAAQMLRALAAWVQLDDDPCTGRALDGGPVLALVRGRVGVSLRLMGGALLVAVVVGALFGGLLARARGLPDRLGRAALAVTEAVPSFVSASLAVWLLALALSWISPVADGSWRSLLVPAFALAAPTSATIARVVRDSLRAPSTSMRRRSDRAAGHSPARAQARALQLALLPVVAALGAQASALWMAAIAVERAFDVPGLGPLVLSSASTRDYNAVLACVLTYAVLILCTNLAIDVLYANLDPRVRAARPATATPTTTTEGA